jgi:hypothetical protein
MVGDSLNQYHTLSVRIFFINTKQSQIGHKHTSIYTVNLPMRSPLLSSHLHQKITFFFSCHRKFHMN